MKFLKPNVKDEPQTRACRRVSVRLPKSNTKMHKYYAIYEVRVTNGVREVQSNGVWMSHEDFVDQLANARSWGQLAAKELKRLDFAVEKLKNQLRSFGFTKETLSDICK